MTKQTNWHVRRAKTQISLGIQPGTLATQQNLLLAWAGAHIDLNLRWAHMPFCCFVVRWHIMVVSI